jgi:tRNA (guanine-N7-)-methyltransferase
MTDHNTASNPDFPTRKFYGRRKGKAMTKRRQGLIETLLPKLALDLPDNDTVDPSQFFEHKAKDIWLEIGFGDGEHLALQAESHPDTGFIGCEPFMNGVAGLLCEVEERRLDNIRLWADDARDLMDALPVGCLGRCFLLHPDPWPKTRHHKRRFIQDSTVKTLARLLKPGAELRIATDDADLCDWMLYHVEKSPSFEWQAEKAEDWRTPPADWPVTRYGEKQLAGIPVYMTFLRVAEKR